jgi:hypothetical protein
MPRNKSPRLKLVNKFLQLAMLPFLAQLAGEDKDLMPRYMVSLGSAVFAISTLSQSSSAQRLTSVRIAKNPIELSRTSRAICTGADLGSGFELRLFRATQSVLRPVKFPEQTYADCPNASVHAVADGAARHSPVLVADVRSESPLEAYIRAVPIPKVPAAGLAEQKIPPLDDETAERRRISTEANDIFTRQKFQIGTDVDALETLMARYRDRQEYTNAGVSKLAVVYNRLDRIRNDWTAVIPSTDAWERNTLDRWIASHPTSPTPYIYRATFMTERALAALRDKFGRSNSADNADGARKRLEEARQYLLDHRDIASRDPHWYALMIRIMRVEAAPIDAILEVMLEGADRYPAYHSIYFETARAMGRRSRKPLDDIEALAVTAVEKSRNVIGDEMYARIYWVAIIEVVGINELPNLKWDWNKMKSSMQTVLGRYDNQWNVQTFALFSCVNEDREQTRSLMARVRGLPNLDLWGQREVYEACSRWTEADAAPKSPSKDERKAGFDKH